MATFTPLDAVDKRALPARPHHVPLGIVIDKTCRVYIANIPVERIERDGATALRSEFECFGPIESYRLFTERSGRFLGTALCTYRNPADAALAVKSMHGRVVESATLRVEVARDHGVVLLRRDVALPSSATALVAADAASGGAATHGLRQTTNTTSSSSSSSRGGGDEEDKWHHDRYDALQRGGDEDKADDGDTYGAHRYRGGRGWGRGNGRGRGRGGWRTREERIEREFERYIAERDRVLGVATTTTTTHEPQQQQQPLTTQDEYVAEHNGNDNNSSGKPDDDTAQ